MPILPADFRPARILTGLAASAATIALLAGCSAGAPADADAGSGRTVDTVLGEITVPEQIDSVVVIEGRRDLDIALALELPVVGFPIEEEGALELESPLADARSLAEENGATGLFLADEINIEALAEAAPSLIISRSDDVEPILDELTAIAPVLAIGEQDVSTWQQDLLLVGEATGTTATAEALIAEYDARVADVAATYADVIATTLVVPLGTDADGSQVRPNRLLSTVLQDVGAAPSAAFAEAIATGDGVESGPEQLFDAFKDADGIVALVNVADEWAATQANPLWTQLPAVQAGHVVRSDKSTHEGGPITAMHALDVVEALYATF
ncbi:ABC transporter substrate-binding protein [Cryobacterium sp. SO2]|uniref:ABC transporter substrate-binding protein n=1 Tax=Cryobacterium sp. SO2 TaxID=1897060 RepID=UPI00223E2D35|nr:ABC transporter substrate-binding protein [Cryobacterium sp. SO2]WEO78442.1 ABC transporter substrate-binding protein [Cryobacterium sp. SO2]